MPDLTEMDRTALRDLEQEERNPGEGLISQAHCDQLVTMGLATGTFDKGYRLTEEGRAALRK
jgi:hypothetical protein